MINAAEATCRYGSKLSVSTPCQKYMPPSATTHTIKVCESVAQSPSSTACITVPRTAMMNAAIIVFECPGSRPCSAPRNTAVGR